jgi:hypothetical protein
MLQKIAFSRGQHLRMSDASYMTMTSGNSTMKRASISMRLLSVECLKLSHSLPRKQQLLRERSKIWLNTLAFGLVAALLPATAAEMAPDPRSSVQQGGSNAKGAPNDGDQPRQATVTAVPENTSLTTLSTRQFSAVYRLGFAAAGDGGGAFFVASDSPCPLNSGNGDGGWQVRSLDGNCWVGDLSDRIAVPEIWGSPHDGAADDGPAIQAMLSAAAAGMPASRLGFRCTNRSYIIRTGVTITSPMHLSGCSNKSLPILIRNAITAFNVTAPGVIIENMYMMGDRTSGQIGINNIGSQNLVHNVRVDLTDIGVQQGLGAGFMNRYERVSGRNSKSYFLTLLDGVGPVVDDVFYDTDGVWYSCKPCYAAPTGAGILLETEGAIITHHDIIHGGAASLMINAHAAHHASGPIWAEIGQGYFDSTDNGAGVLINNQSGGTVPIRGIHFIGTWMATGLYGLKTATDPLSYIDTVFCDGCQIHNNVYDGVLLTGNTSRLILGNSIISSNDAPMPPGFGKKIPGMYANLNFQQTATKDAGLVVVNGGYVGRAEGWSHRPHYNLSAATTGIEIWITGTFFDAAGAITANINNAGPANIHFGTQ